MWPLVVDMGNNYLDVVVLYDRQICKYNRCPLGGNMLVEHRTACSIDAKHISIGKVLKKEYSSISILRSHNWGWFSKKSPCSFCLLLKTSQQPRGVSDMFLWGGKNNFSTDFSSSVFWNVFILLNRPTYYTVEWRFLWWPELQAILLNHCMEIRDMVVGNIGIATVVLNLLVL